MVIPFQGFQTDKNLSESQNDRDILNNLGDSPIADDLLRFKNNKRNVSIIVVAPSDIIGNKIFINNAKAVFSNRTKITVNGTTYYIVNSNGINEFSLSTTEDLLSIVANPPTGNYVRSDEVTQENISFFSLDRLRTRFSNTEEDSGFELFNNYYLQNTTQKQALENIEQNISFYSFRNNKALQKTKNFFSQTNNNIEGCFIIYDVDNVNGTTLPSSGPGIFIYNPSTQTGIRAFSSNENPWNDDTPDTLTTTSSKITVGNFRFASNTITIEEKTPGDLLSVQSGTMMQTTHKIAANINGEEYFILIRQV